MGCFNIFRRRKEYLALKDTYNFSYEYITDYELLFQHPAARILKPLGKNHNNSEKSNIFDYIQNFEACVLLHFLPDWAENAHEMFLD